MRKKTRILISVLSKAFGGMEKFPPDLCFDLQKQNLNVSFISLEDSKTLDYASKIGIKKYTL